MTQASERDLIFVVERYYSALMTHAAPDAAGGESGLGGQLFYAGELNDEGRAVIIAANVAGAASLSICVDPAAQKAAIRDGIVDFVVTNLDEALRILKNEIRKRQPVAVCLAQGREGIELEMIERGVQPDLVVRPLPGHPRPSEQMEPVARPLIVPPEPTDLAIVTWGLEKGPALWMPKIDAIAAACMEPDEAAARRWLKLGGRYLGRLARGLRLVHCRPESARRAAEQIRAAVEDGRIGVPVRLCLDLPGEPTFVYEPVPPTERPM